jgi:hypothetical protein
MVRLESGARIFAIVEVVPDRHLRPYVGVRLDRGPLTRRYRLGEDEILAKIGTLDAEALKLDPAQVARVPSRDWQLGQYFAQYMAERASADLDRRRWRLLASLQPGDPVVLRRFTRRGEHIEQHCFQAVLPTGQKYHFTAVNPNGTVYKWTLESLHLESEKVS